MTLFSLCRYFAFFMAIEFAVTVNAQPIAATTEFDSIYKQANNLYKQSKYEEASPLAKKALEAAEKTGGKESKQVIQALYLLGSIHLSLWEADTAESLLKRAVKISSKIPGLEEFDTVNVLDKLAECYEELDKETEAEKLYRHALELREKKLPANHQDIGLSYSNLARVLSAQKNYKEAEPLFQKAIAHREKVLGKNHPDLAETFDAYACLLKRTERKDEAFKAFDHANELLYQSVTDKSAPLEIPFKSFSCRYLSLESPKNTTRPVIANGKVILIVLADESGKIIQARAINGPSQLYSSAENNALRITLKPAVINGKAIKMVGRYTFRFETRVEFSGFGTNRLGQ